MPKSLLLTLPKDIRGEYMFKSPIAKNGQIRYFEIVKIAAIVLTLFAGISKINENTPTLLETLELMFTVQIILLVALFVLVVNEIRTFIRLINSFKIKLRSYRIKQNIITVIEYVKTVILLHTEKIFIKLNVLRC